MTPDRQVFLRNAALGLAAAASPMKADAAFPSLKQIDAGLLNVGYAESGPANGRAVLLLHGWPYDIHCYADAARLLAAEGYRVIVPYLRGYGTTRFLRKAFATDSSRRLHSMRST